MTIGHSQRAALQCARVTVSGLFISFEFRVRITERSVAATPGISFAASQLTSDIDIFIFHVRDSAFIELSAYHRPKEKRQV